MAIALKSLLTSSSLASSKSAQSATSLSASKQHQSLQQQHQHETAKIFTSAASAVGSATATFAYRNNHSVTQVYESENVNGLAMLASLTLQKVLNINNINNNNNNNHINSYQQTLQNMQQHNQQHQLLNAAAIENQKENILINEIAATTTAATTSTSRTTTPNAIKNKNNKQKHNTITTTTTSSSSISPTKATLSAAAAATPTTTKTPLCTSVLHSNNSNNNTPNKGNGNGLGNTNTAIITTTNNNNGSNVKVHTKIPSDILDDLASRFIINVPDIELTNLIRICFQIELAHWFYLDFYCSSNNNDAAATAQDASPNIIGGGVPQQLPQQPQQQRKLQTMGIKQFAIQLFQHIPFLRQHVASAEQILEDWKNYKLSVPTYGAILVSEDLNYCLLVQSYFARSSWGFPKGKINEHEDPAHCATREVYEETGYDITELIDTNDFIDAIINYQYTRLYIVRNIPLGTKFVPRTRNEIKCCDWFRIDSLPVNKNDAISKMKLGMNANSFFMIMPFVKRLKKWVGDRKIGIELTRRRKCSTSVNGSGGTSSPKSISPTYQERVLKGNRKKSKNNSCSSNNSDDKNALNLTTCSINGSGNGGVNVVIATTTYTNQQQQERSKRQRHKSMGDLDGIKLNNLACNIQQPKQEQNQQSVTIADNTTTTITTMTTPTLGGNQNNIKRNIASSITKNVAAGGNATNANGNNTNQNSNNVAGNNNNINNKPTIKRQLFHSQSQNDAQQQNEKLVSSFDIIRKEKQQQQLRTNAKVQQQHAVVVGNGSGRVRAKSQSDKNCQLQQQQQQKHNNNNTNNNTTPNQKILNQQRLQQKQQQAKPNNNNSSNNNKCNKKQMNAINGFKTPPPPSTTAAAATVTATTFCIASNASENSPHTPTTGMDLIAMLAAAAATTATKQNEQMPAAAVAATTTTNSYHLPTVNLRPRPASVALNFTSSSLQANNYNNKYTYAHSDGENLAEIVNAAGTMQKLERMASGTNLRMLKRATSQQPIIRRQQQQQQQQQLSFTPNFNSWTNFSFTKNFIANVFC